MNPLKGPLHEAQEGADARATTLTPIDRNRAAYDRLWVRQHERAARVVEQQKERARKKNAARNRKYRQARALERAQ